MFQQVPQRLDEADGGHEDKQGGGREEQPLPEVGLVPVRGPGTPRSSGSSREGPPGEPKQTPPAVRHITDPEGEA